MKIIKKPKMPQLECPRCGCVFKPHRRDLQWWVDEKEPFHVTAACPVCKKVLDVFSDKNAHQ